MSEDNPWHPLTSFLENYLVSRGYAIAGALQWEGNQRAYHIYDDNGTPAILRLYGEGSGEDVPLIWFEFGIGIVSDRNATSVFAILSQKLSGCCLPLRLNFLPEANGQQLIVLQITTEAITFQTDYLETLIDGAFRLAADLRNRHELQPLPIIF